MTTERLERFTAAQNAHRKAWNDRAEARKNILAQYGVTIDDSGNLGISLNGGIADHWNRLIRLEYSSYEGWQAGTTGVICKPEELDRMIAEGLEVRSCITQLQMIGDKGGITLKMSDFT